MRISDWSADVCSSDLHTFTDALTAMPPSLRFYAGGDRSIRGYEWRGVGPRIGDFSIGAKNVVTTSVEFERYFTQRWGGAVFVDSGRAFRSDARRVGQEVVSSVRSRWSPVQAKKKNR